jgi:hypothetical protein
MAEQEKIKTGMAAGNNNNANNQLDCRNPTTKAEKIEPIP